MVTAIALGLVLATVSVEQGGVPWESMVNSWMLHGLDGRVAGPLLSGVSTALTLMRMEHRGEIAALACMGLGRARLRAAVLSAGAAVGLLTLLVSAVILPGSPTQRTSVWTARSVARRFTVADRPEDRGAAHHPRDVRSSFSAPAQTGLWAALRWAGGLGESGADRSSFACTGLHQFAVLGLRASAWSRPWSPSWAWALFCWSRSCWAGP